jgi:hypothetical protein
MMPGAPDPYKGAPDMFDGTDQSLIDSQKLPRPDENDPLELEGFIEVYGYAFVNHDDRIPIGQAPSAKQE